MKSAERLELLQRFNSREQGAMEEIYGMHYAGLFNTIRHFMHDDGEAKDLATDVFVKLFMQRKQFVSLSKLRSYLYVIARNKCLDFLKKKKRADKRKKEFEYYWQQVMDEKVDFMRIREEMSDRYAAEIEKLSPQCRNIFVMFHLQDMPAREIAERLHISEKTVFNQASIAREMLRLALGKIDGMYITIFMAASYQQSFCRHLFMDFLLRKYG